MGPLIGETIHSCLDQTYRNIEIIVVDDGSTDDTAAKVSSFLSLGVKYVLQCNHGAPAAARNHGTRLASGKYLQFLDADDLIHPEKILEQVTQIEARKCEYAVSYCDYLFLLTMKKKHGTEDSVHLIYLIGRRPLKNNYANIL